MKEFDPGTEPSIASITDGVRTLPVGMPATSLFFLGDVAVFVGAEENAALVNEAGEVAGKIKKVFRDKGGEISDETRESLKAELGDVFWYIAQVATELGLSLDEIAEYNIAKLYDRLERGKIRGDGDNR